MQSSWKKISAYCLEVGDIVRLGRAFTCYKISRIDETRDKIILLMDNDSIWTFNIFDEVECQDIQIYNFNDESIYAHEGA